MVNSTVNVNVDTNVILHLHKSRRDNVFGNRLDIFHISGQNFNYD